MKKVLTIGASTSSKSINKRLAKYTAEQIKAEMDLLDLNDFEMPIYSVDREEESGHPEKAKEFRQRIKNCDGIVISLSEHNGSFTAAFKNILDWASRVESGLWEDKPMFLLATSPGARGAAKVFNHAKEDWPYRGGNIVSSFSLPSFYENFTNDGIKDGPLKTAHGEALQSFQSAL